VTAFRSLNGNAPDELIERGKVLPDSRVLKRTLLQAGSIGYSDSASGVKSKAWSGPRSRVETSILASSKSANSFQ
jgi:hypothetical protein